MRKIIQSWIDAGTPADEIIARLSHADGPIAARVHQMVAESKTPGQPVIRKKDRKDRFG